MYVGGGDKPIELGPGTATALLYVRFRAVASPQLMPILSELARRAKQPEYVRLLSECEQLYCNTRCQLVLPFVLLHIESLKTLRLPELTRCVYISFLQVVRIRDVTFTDFVFKIK